VDAVVVVFEMAPVGDAIRPRAFLASASHAEVSLVGAARVDEAATRQEVALPRKRRLRRRRRDVFHGEASDEHHARDPKYADHSSYRYELTHLDLLARSLTNGPVHTVEYVDAAAPPPLLSGITLGLSASTYGSGHRRQSGD